MPTETSIELSPSDLAQIVESVFGTMMDLEVSEGGTPWSPSGNRVTATVLLVGDWSGAVLVECDRKVACGLTGRFLSIDPPETVDDSVRDVMGEMANMIGGNLKALLTRGIQLSMPSVVEGSGYVLRVVGAKNRNWLAFQCSEGVFWTAVHTA